MNLVHVDVVAIDRSKCCMAPWRWRQHIPLRLWI